MTLLCARCLATHLRARRASPCALELPTLCWRYDISNSQQSIIDTHEEPRNHGIIISPVSETPPRPFPPSGSCSAKSGAIMRNSEPARTAGGEARKVGILIVIR